jgi:hypothetical protein
VSSFKLENIEAVQKPSNAECNIPSAESFRNEYEVLTAMFLKTLVGIHQVLESNIEDGN